MNKTFNLPVARYFRSGLPLQRLPLQFWAIFLILMSGGIGLVSTNWLLVLPKSPQCNRVFWPVASASMRLYCAQLSAEEKTVDGLLRAINLLAALPKDHPLAVEVNRNIETWATDLLDLAEDYFQKGLLEEAIAAAEKIPDHVQAYDLVEERINAWRGLWQEGETIYGEVEADLRNSRWNSAFRNAVRLLNLDNTFWSTTKYDQAIRNIQIAQEESSKLDNAYRILRRGGADNWLKAIEDAAKIPKDSYAYQEAQKLIAQAVDKLTGSIETMIERQDWQTLNNTLSRLPESYFPAKDLNDWQILATAGLEAQMGTVEGLGLAITTAEKLTDSNSPYYNLAQELVKDWRREETALQQLAQARNTAEIGTISALNEAIAQAKSITKDNPRHQEASRDIANWTERIQIDEDRPILRQARQLANAGNLEQAIQQAERIGAGRALYSEARQSINQWQATIQRRTDQPILDQAIALANAQNYEAAISTARQIERNRALSGEARLQISRWQAEINAQNNLKRAQEMASSRTVDSLGQAVQLIRQVPRSTDAGGQRLQLVNNWSYQILSLAQEQARAGNYQQAIRALQQIPAESAAHNSAQNFLQEWRSFSQPSPLPITPVAPPAPRVESPVPTEPALPPVENPQN
ncbi:chromosome segregation ATPase [Synechocystis sp. PCC 7339]|uniref:chromosome segregation ATPase n=1 Tax=Synechocystis sp. PCC 7339 TaxID=2782213 RepID=UPI001CC1573F|nr:chromosome segregation ATPase [Synechocystis sp. PCC 7339]UAJ73828.1 chromosome segregation ATPase [Synechocystis sp. PCC 7339]